MKKKPSFFKSYGSSQAANVLISGAEQAVNELISKITGGNGNFKQGETTFVLKPLESAEKSSSSTIILVIAKNFQEFIANPINFAAQHKQAKYCILQTGTENCPQPALEYYQENNIFSIPYTGKESAVELQNAILKVYESAKPSFENTSQSACQIQ